MMAIDPNSLNQKENYKLLIGSIVPRPIAFITTLSSDNVVNAAPFSFFNIVSSDPPMVSVSVQRINGAMKDTARNIVETNELVLHIVDEKMVEEMNKTAANLPPNESELELTHLHVTDSVKVAVPGVKEAKIRMEAILSNQMEIKNDRGEIVADLFLARIICYHIQDDLYENGRIDINGLTPVSRLAGNDYALLGEKITITRPI